LSLRYLVAPEWQTTPGKVWFSRIDASARYEPLGCATGMDRRTAHNIPTQGDETVPKNRRVECIEMRPKPAVGLVDVIADVLRVTDRFGRVSILQLQKCLGIGR